MSWVAFTVPVFVTLAVIAVLGLPAALALRLRGFAIAVVSIPAALAVMAISSIAAPFVGVRWSILPAIVCAIVLAAILLPLRRFIAAPRDQKPRKHDLWVSLGGAAIGGVAIATALVFGLGNAGIVSQTFDAGFHLNAVRYIIDQGNASPLAMDLTSPGAPVFYPTLWHAFVVLIVQLTGVSIPMATNAVLFLSAAVVWPIGAVALGRAIAGPSTRVTVISGALTAAFPNFPLYLAGYGVIYPNFLALALMPFLLVAVLQLLNLGPARRAMPLTVGTRWLLALGALGAATLSHPNTIHTLLVWIAIPVVAVALRAWLGRPVPGPGGVTVQPATPLAIRRTGAVVGVATLLLAIAAAWIGGRTSDNAWEGSYDPIFVLVQLVGGTPHIEGHSWAMTVLILLGVLLAWRRRSLRWLVGCAAGLALLYIVSDGFKTHDWRTWITGPWYNDPRRLAALVPLGALPLAVLGASAAWAMLRPGLKRFASFSPRSSRRAEQLLAAMSVALLLGIGQGGAVPATAKVDEGYSIEKARVLSAEEIELLERLPEEVPEDAVIANNPLNGSGLAYALADRAVLFPHGSGAYGPKRFDLVNALVPDPVLACTLSEELNVQYVLDFGQDFIFADDPIREKSYEDMKDLDTSPILTEVDREGDDAVLYKITGCEG